MLRESDDKQKLDYILDNISDGIVVLNKDGDILSINKNACAVFDLKDVVGKITPYSPQTKDFPHTFRIVSKTVRVAISSTQATANSIWFQHARSKTRWKFWF